jgi:hypothetical protein
MDVTLVALLLICAVLVGLHAPYAMLTLSIIIILSAVATRLSWAVLRSFEPAKVTQRIWD